MKNGFLIFLAALIALGGSWLGFVYGPVRQLGGAGQTTVLNSTDTYPVQRTGDAALGLQVYRANGCAACHTEQVRQTGIEFSVALTDAGKNPEAVTNLISSLKLTGLTKEDADKLVDKITAAGAKAEIHIAATGPDIARGWGMRQSVAEDYLYDQPVQLGSLRAGPDLANIGVRAPDANWQLTHLYAPSGVVKGSTMPSFRYLFDLRRIGAAPSPEALQFPKDFVLPAGYEVVPKPEARQLAAYLLSLRANAPLYSAPISP
jgi:cytochrome c oxidase cbb3-type subunit 2